MKTLSVAQCRKRLTESSEKIWKVCSSDASMSVNQRLTSKDFKDLMNARIVLIRCIRKLK